MKLSGLAITAGLGAAAGAVAIMMMPRQNPVRKFAAKAANNLLKVNGIRASFAIIRVGDAVRISARSNGTLNVQLIMAELGGGGHYDSAAMQRAGASIEDITAELKTAIDKYL